MPDLTQDFIKGLKEGIETHRKIVFNLHSEEGMLISQIQQAQEGLRTIQPKLAEAVGYLKCLENNLGLLEPGSLGKENKDADV